jgi:hypothetical protein
MCHKCDTVPLSGAAACSHETDLAAVGRAAHCECRTLRRTGCVGVQRSVWFMPSEMANSLRVASPLRASTALKQTRYELYGHYGLRHKLQKLLSRN